MRSTQSLGLHFPPRSKKKNKAWGSRTAAAVGDRDQQMVDCHATQHTEYERNMDFLFELRDPGSHLKN